MSTMVNRPWFWAVNPGVQACVCVEQDFATARCVVRLNCNAARHVVKAFDLFPSEGEALKRVEAMERERIAAMGDWL